MPYETRLFATWVAFVAAAVGVDACKKTSSEQPSSHVDGGTAVSAEAGALPMVRILPDSGPLATGIPVPASKVEAAINPQHAEPYAGPTGVIEGTVKVSGDPAPGRKLDIPFGCGEAYATYDKAFREGNGRMLADVMLAVTGYEGFVPAPGDAHPVRIRGCAYDQRTVVMTYGQFLQVQNADDKESFIPLLQGATHPAQMVAVPHGDPVKLYPIEVGHYALAEGSNHAWMDADVFVLRYATHAVTGLDGRYRIAGIPPGKVKIAMYAPLVDAALHPEVGVAASSQEREIEVKSGETARADFVLSYKAPKPMPKTKKAPELPIVK